MTIRILCVLTLRTRQTTRSADNDLLTHAKERMEFRLSQLLLSSKRCWKLTPVAGTIPLSRFRIFLEYPLE